MTANKTISNEFEVLFFSQTYAGRFCGESVTQKYECSLEQIRDYCSNSGVPSPSSCITPVKIAYTNEFET